MFLHEMLLFLKAEKYIIRWHSAKPKHADMRVLKPINKKQNIIINLNSSLIICENRKLNF